MDSKISSCRSEQRAPSVSWPGDGVRFLIVGCGSMGKRRARGLVRLGAEFVAGVDPHEDRRGAIAAESGIETFADFDAALAFRPDIVLICCAPHLHAEYLHACIERGLPVFCEAPMTMTLEEADAVIAASEARKVFLAPSCTYLHHPIHAKIRNWIESGTFGRPLAAVSHVGQHIADWHPYEDYRGFYASKRSQGGMGFDMLPHDLHLFTAFFGEVRGLACFARRRAADIETDPEASDVYDVLLDMDSGVSLIVHQDLFQRPWGAWRKIAFERGAVEWHWRMLRSCAYPGPGFLQAPPWEEHPVGDGDFESMYVAEILHALRAWRGEEAYRMPPRRERRVLEYVLACEESSTSGRRIEWPRDHV